QGLLVFTRDAADRLERFSSGLREVEGIPAPIVWTVSPFHQSARLQVVDQGDETAGKNVEMGGERLLAHVSTAGEGAQDARVGRHEVQWRKPLGKSHRSVAAHLGEQPGS